MSKLSNVGLRKIAERGPGMSDYYKFMSDLDKRLNTQESRLGTTQPAYAHADSLGNLGDTSLDPDVVAELGQRGRSVIKGFDNLRRQQLQELLNKLPSSAGKLSELFTFDRADIDKLKQYSALYRSAVKDITEEGAAEQVGSILDKLRIRGLGYGLSGVGGGALGALIAGKGNRLLGGGIGVVAGLLANYLRRKSYYGKNISW